MKKTFNFVIIAFIIVLILINVAVIYQKIFHSVKQPIIGGFSYAVVVSGSMEDAISVDDFIITKEEKSYKKGDIIMFGSEDNVVTHRIVDKTDEGFITKGDANNSVDTLPVKESSIYGKVIVTIPYLGRLIQFLSSPIGALLWIFIGFALIKRSSVKRMN